jgi:cobalt-zinc-cadmium efflux system protein
MSGAHTHHHHDHHLEISKKNLGWAVVLNLLITLAQVVGGLISGSMALLTDALHNFSDVVSLLLSFFAHRLAHRKITLKQTFGFKRAEILAAFINALTLIAIAVFLLVEASKLFFETREIASDLVIYFALGGIIVNALSVVLLQRDAHRNLNMKSAYLHLLTDLLTSVAVLVGGIVMKYTGFFYIDSFLSILIATYLIWSSAGILKSSYKILMQFSPANYDIEVIAEEIKGIESIKNVHHVHLWQLNEKDIFFEAHISMTHDARLQEFEQVLDRVELILLAHDITHFNIQPEFKRCSHEDLIPDD